MDPAPLTYGEYEVCQRLDGTPMVLGQGSSSITYKAVPRGTGFGSSAEGPSAVKVFKPGRVASESKRSQFFREVSVLGRIQHPNVVAYLKQGEEKGEIYYVIEFCGGGSLEDFCLKTGGLTPAQLSRVATQTLDALAAVHASGHVHGEITPSKLLLHQDSGGTDLTVKLAGFGSVRQIDGTPDAGAPHTEGSLKGESFLGSPLFASPEQFMGHRLGHGSDLYSLGITLWFLALGYSPFQGVVGAVKSWHLSASPHVIALPDSFPAGFSDILAWMVAKNPADRPPDLMTVKNNFTALLNESPASRPVAASEASPPSANFSTAKIEKIARTSTSFTGLPPPPQSRTHASITSEPAHSSQATETRRTAAASAPSATSANLPTQNVEKITGTATGVARLSPSSPPSRTTVGRDITTGVVARGKPRLAIAIGIVLVTALGGGAYLAWQKWGKAKPPQQLAKGKTNPPQQSSASAARTNTSTTPTTTAATNAATTGTTPPAPPPTIPVPASYELPEGTSPKQPTIKVNGRITRTSPFGKGFSIALDGATGFPVEIEFSAPGHESRTITLNGGDKPAFNEMVKLKRTEGKVILSSPPEGTDFTIANFKFLRPLESERDHVPIISISLDKALATGSNQSQFVIPTGVYKVVLRSDHPERITPRTFNESIEVTANSETRAIFPPSVSGKWILRSSEGASLEIRIDKGLGGGSLDTPEGRSVATISAIRVPNDESVVISLDAPDGERELSLKLPGGKFTGATYTMNPALAPLPAEGEAMKPWFKP
ncbi:MAG: serine/threonine protein kinase [Verrucomicrobiales bacterium]